MSRADKAALRALYLKACEEWLDARSAYVAHGFSANDADDVDVAYVIVDAIADAVALDVADPAARIEARALRGGPPEARTTIARLDAARRVRDALAAAKDGVR